MEIKNEGRIVQVIGPVIDIEFPEGELPAIYNAVKITNPRKLTGAIDLRRTENSIVVTKAEAGLSQKYERAVKAIAVKTPITKSPAEILLEEARAHAKVDIAKITLAGIASLVALSGLLTDNSVLVIAAMLLSPILGPLYGFTINVVLGKAAWAGESLYSLFKLLAGIFGTSFIMTILLVQVMGIQVMITREIALRASPSLPYLGIAVILGYAGMVAIVKRIAETLAGVAIAAALVPPLTVFGISLGAGWMTVAAGSLVLTLENVVGLLVGSLVAAQTLGISPRRYYEKKVARHHILRTALVLALLTATLLIIEAVRAGIFN